MAKLLILVAGIALLIFGETPWTWAFATGLILLGWKAK
jgi:hypothetical protein